MTSFIHTKAIAIEQGMSHFLLTIETDISTGFQRLVGHAQVDAAKHLAALEAQAKALGYKITKMTDEEVTSATADLSSRLAAASAAASQPTVPTA
jgi:hypothetical protein